MKIKGVVRNRKRRPDGKRKGDIIELTPEEKVPHAVQVAISKEAPEDEVWCTCREGFTLTNVKVQPLGPRKDGKPFANNAYSAVGKATWWKSRLNSQSKSKNKVASFKIEFKDVLDYLGMPDIEVTKFEMK